MADDPGMDSDDSDVDEATLERREIIRYLEEHALGANISTVLNKVVGDQPEKPFLRMREELREYSKPQKGIIHVKGRKILTSQGFPTLEVEVKTLKGSFIGHYSLEETNVEVEHKPKKKKQKKKKKKKGQGGDDDEEKPLLFNFYDKVQPRKAPNGMPLLNNYSTPLSAEKLDHLIKSINDIVQPALQGMDPKKQKQIDDLLVHLAVRDEDEEEPDEEDEEEAEAEEGASKPRVLAPIEVLMPVSMAVCRAGAAAAGVSLSEHIANLRGPLDKEAILFTQGNEEPVEPEEGKEPPEPIEPLSEEEAKKHAANFQMQIPVPVFCMIEGGRFHSCANFCQEISLMPVGATTFIEALEIGQQVYIKLRKLVLDSGDNVGCCPGKMGGLRPMVELEQAIDLVLQAAEEAGHTDKIKICLNIASTYMATEKMVKVIPEPESEAEAEEGEGGEQEEEEDSEEDEEPKEIIKYFVDYYPNIFIPKPAAPPPPEEGEEPAEPPAEEETVSYKPCKGEEMLDRYANLLDKYGPILASLEQPFAIRDTETRQPSKGSVSKQLRTRYDPPPLPTPEEQEAERLRKEAEEAKAASKKGGKGKKDKKPPPKKDAPSADAEGEEGEEEELRACVGGESSCLVQLAVSDADVEDFEVFKPTNKMRQANAVVINLSRHLNMSNLVQFAREAQHNGCSTILNGCGLSGAATTDNFASEMAVGLSVGQFKAGAPCHTEYLSSYNELVRLESRYQGKADFAGANFRNHVFQETPPPPPPPPPPPAEEGEDGEGEAAAE